MDRFLGMPPLASAHASDIDQLLIMIHLFMLVLGVGWALFFAFTLIRFRQSKNAEADYTGVTSSVSKYLEVGVIIVEAILLVGFSFPLWSRRVDAFPPENQSTVVHVVAEQFAWNIHYPGPDGIFGKRDPKLVSAGNPLGLDTSDPNAKDDITTINQMHLPVDKPAIIHITSKDVIHSFGLREMRIMQDAMPGMSIPVWFTPIRKGDYEIPCAQLCGLGHYRMRGFLKVEDEANFNKWLQDQKAASQGGDGGGEAASNAYD
jgi:cytochrome c oxidase subunit 2